MEVSYFLSNIFFSFFRPAFQYWCYSCYGFYSFDKMEKLRSLKAKEKGVAKQAASNIGWREGMDNIEIPKVG